MTSKERQFLVVDDNRMERLKLSRALESLGYTVGTAESGPQAIEMLRARSFDLVILDIMMPIMDGFEVLAQLKSNQDLRDIPVIVVSGTDDSHSVQSCLELGAQAHLSKPVTADALQVAIEACMKETRPADQGH